MILPAISQEYRQFREPKKTGRISVRPRKASQLMNRDRHLACSNLGILGSAAAVVSQT